MAEIRALGADKSLSSIFSQKHLSIVGLLHHAHPEEGRQQGFKIGPT
jgi:hypothetical protein